MKCISASIIVLSGSILLAVGSQHRHDQTQAFLAVTGSVVGLIGLVNWLRAFGASSSEPQ